MGYSGPEVDIALQRGEVDARSHLAGSVLQRTPELLEKGLADFHAVLETPKGRSPLPTRCRSAEPHVATLPDV